MSYTNKDILLDEIWAICSELVDGNIPIKTQVKLEALSEKLDNFKTGRFIHSEPSNAPGKH